MTAFSPASKMVTHKSKLMGMLRVMRIIMTAACSNIDVLRKYSF